MSLSDVLSAEEKEHLACNYFILRLLTIFAAVLAATFIAYVISTRFFPYQWAGAGVHAFVTFVCR